MEECESSGLFSSGSNVFSESPYMFLGLEPLWNVALTECHLNAEELSSGVIIKHYSSRGDNHPFVNDGKVKPILFCVTCNLSRLLCI